LKKQQTSSSSSSNKISFPLFASPIPELTSCDDNRASYDNILNYCLNPSNESNTIYEKFNFNQKNFTSEEQFERRCANYDNLSYLVIDKISPKKFSNKGIGKIASCKDYFAATTGFSFNENGQRE
jgi:hypothetical protein